MSHTATIHEAKTHLSRLVNRALAGEEVIISRRNQPVVRLQPCRGKPVRRKIGSLPGLVERMPDDFNAPIDDWDAALAPAVAAPRRRKRP